MKCYTHHAVDAVAICRSCCRALCPDCVAEVGTACACKGRCEERVTALNAMVVRGGSAYKRLKVAPLFTALLGTVFIIGGISSGWDPFVLSMGAVFLLWSGVTFISYSRHK